MWAGGWAAQSVEMLVVDSVVRKVVKRVAL